VEFAALFVDTFLFPVAGVDYVLFILVESIRKLSRKEVHVCLAIQVFRSMWSNFVRLFGCLEAYNEAARCRITVSHNWKSCKLTKGDSE